MDDYRNLRNEVPKKGLKTLIGGRQSLLDLGRQLWPLMNDALKRRAILNDKGQDESRYLAPIGEILESGQSLSDRLLARYHQTGNLDFIYQECDWAQPLILS